MFLPKILNFNPSRFKDLYKYNHNIKHMSTFPRTNLIVAVDSNWGISKQNSIPWMIKEDSTFFQDVTKRVHAKDKKNVVIMGRNTWKALPDSFRGLKDRINIVVSSSMKEDELFNDNVTKSEIYLTKSLTDSMELCKKLNPGKIFIGGGSSIYKEAIEKLNIDEIYLTNIGKYYECDNVFPVDTLGKIITQYKEHSVKKFIVKDRNNDEDVEVSFRKLYKGNLPSRLNINSEEQQYLNLLEDILKTGHFRQTRNSKTWSKFGKTMEFDLSKGFPILTTKKIFLRGVFEELLFFLKGDTNANHLSEKGVKIWDANTTREFLDSVGLNHYDVGDMGPMYGFNWSHYNANYNNMNSDYTGQGFNQIEYCLNLLKKDPFSRRILMTTFNPAVAKQGVLYPCHGISILFNVEEGHKLSCMMTQRSADTFLGIPFNISSYAMLVHLFCEVINNDTEYKGPKFIPGRLIMNLGDVHVYENHHSEVIRQILREPYNFPQLIFKRKVTDLTDFKFEDMELIDYECYPNIPAKMIA
ncbi:bifunctional dihydrofolate reductase/thymidylate synthase [Fadolivirus algeromassiliense]|jgi:dihydrofolate reductase/thymidylate synthase|uniref:thymidylate synthase n=1 Tax=Fadolivirus FV1/VV64 TaxID=3070911 RepID=A0A7D3UV75_9VIRU|nr:bifunctional dihydrofolate reductase/thymidylate synthase [Fadolivirus algeromassiliense]QKF93754.1 bifunctional dihydrofolate reductase/thymidylate synthase [Fadolivirus FV1/VV64]